MCTLEDKENLVAELCHQINSPLAAMRNAMYLASARVQDEAVLHYLHLADEEITAIALILKQARTVIETMRAQTAACGETDCPLRGGRRSGFRVRRASAAMPATGHAA